MPASTPSTPAKHFAYDEVAPELLVDVARYRDTQRIVKMHRVAAEALTRMLRAAAIAGIELVPISGFRSVEYHFASDARDFGDETVELVDHAVDRVLELEHLAVDIGEGPEPESDAEPKFDDTAAYRWLKQNAAGFGFEQSFPENNAQGVGCEPWHWRFIGTPETKEIFAVAREFASKRSA